MWVEFLTETETCNIFPTIKYETKNKIWILNYTTITLKKTYSTVVKRQKTFESIKKLVNTWRHKTGINTKTVSK